MDGPCMWHDNNSRDWPEIDNEEVDGRDQVIEVEQQQAITTDDQVDGAVCSGGTQPASCETEIGKAEIARRFAGSSLQQRRGSSEERYRSYIT